MSVLYTLLLFFLPSSCVFLVFRPLYLPLRVLFTAESFSLSSNIIVDTATFHLRYSLLTNKEYCITLIYYLYYICWNDDQHSRYFEMLLSVFTTLDELVTHNVRSLYKLGFLLFCDQIHPG